MAGNINCLLLIWFLIICTSCKNVKKTEVQNKVYIRIEKNINYNSDVVDYYIVNKTDNDIYILCNSEFFKRQKDSLFINSWFSPKIEIYEEGKLTESMVLSVNYNKKVIDSLNKVKKHYTEILNYQTLKKTDLRDLVKYKSLIKKNDSTKFSTRINFENEPRFYDFSEIEGYILDRTKNYSAKIFLNENISPDISDFLEREHIYSKKICSNNVKINVTKTNYSD